MEERGLGAHLRALRLERGLSVRTLATQTGFSPSFISQVELDAVSPSISSLEKIAVHLGVTLGELFSSLESPQRVIIRNNERKVYSSTWSRSAVESLVDTSGERGLSAVMVRFHPEGSSGGKLAPSLKDMFCMVIAGELILTTEHMTTEVHVGDSVYLQEGDMYRWHNTSDADAELLLVSLAGRVNIFQNSSD